MTRGRASDRTRLARTIKWRQTVIGAGINAVAAFTVATYLLIIFPPTEDAEFVTVPLGLIATGVYVTLASIFGTRKSRRLARPMVAWLATDRPATPEERRSALKLPKRLGWLTFRLWLYAALLFTPAAIDVSVSFAAETATAIVLAGLVTATADYLMTEWSLRPVFAHVLDAEAPSETRSLGVGPRLILTWLLCSGVPLIMIALIPLGRDVEEPRELVLPILFTVGVAFVIGLIATKLSTAAVSRPVRSLRKAMDEVRGGNLDVVAEVTDGSEVGRLQAGFNAMVAGLRERERLHDLFGRQVGLDVAREALERAPSLGGRTQPVSALFVDVVGSTTLAENEPPERVVALLNRFFDIVVGVVDEHGGLVNKFEGDAALCVFGAPIEQPDHPDRALAAARDMAARLQRLEDGLDAAIGVASGNAVAGYVGSESRFEYTVIGDPVNEASRLTELAKHRDGRLLASAAAVEAAGEEEAARWEIDGEVVLRGRSRPTRLAVPGPAAAAEAPQRAADRAGV